jgi:hypothetical protein
MTSKRPYRCVGCNWRGWSVEPDRNAEHTSDAPAPEPPNLKGTGLARHAPSRALDLRALDATHVPAGETKPIDPRAA